MGRTSPTVRQSGKEMRHGRIKKIGTDSMVNWAMCEAANVAVKYDDRMKAIYESARKRHGGKHTLAIIVVANKMITIMWHILTTRTPYESRNQDLYERKLARLNKIKEQ